METRKESFKKQLVVCNSCFGKEKNCLVCGGISRGLWYHGRFFFWQEDINAFSLSLYQFEHFLSFFINSILAIFGIIGFVFLGMEFQNASKMMPWIFFLSVFTDCYLISRLKRRADFGRIPVFHSDDLLSAPDIRIARALPKNFQINFVRFLSARAMGNIFASYRVARKYEHAFITPLHLFASLLSSRILNIMLLRLNISKSKLVSDTARVLEKYPQKGNAPFFSAGSKESLMFALWNTFEQKKEHLDLMDIFVGIILLDEEVAEIFYGLGVEVRELEYAVQWMELDETLVRRWKFFRHRARFKPGGAMDKAMTAVATPFLDICSEDLTLLAKFGRTEFTVGRKREIDELFRIIESGEKSVILLGPSGVGKSAILSAVAERMVSEDVPKELSDKRLVALSLEKLLAGASAEEAQGRLLNILEEVKRAGNIILVISGIENSMGIRVGEHGGLDLSEILARPISLREIIIIATATLENYTESIEGTLLGEALQKIRIDEPSKEDAMQMVESKISRIEYTYKVFFSISAVSAAVELTFRYVHDAYLPKKAIDILEETAVHVVKKRGEKAIVNAIDVAELLSAKTRIPLARATQKESEVLLHLEEEIHHSIIDQKEAVETVSKSIRRARAELRDEKRPIVNLLFLGPTGVGKTELSKTVARIYFGGETEMIRLDMSEYQDASSVYRMIGAPPGTSGSEKGGYLTEAVRKNPFGLLLLDEIEKAHPDILNIFLQVMDDGRLTDNQGRTIDFTNLMIIATSNAGGQFIQDELRKGETVESIETRLVEEVLKQYFRPEFLNRFDGIVVFKPLSMEDVGEITKLFLKKVEKRLENQGFHFEYSPQAVSEIAKAGFHPEFGARPLRRVIQEHVDDGLAKLILSGSLSRRDTIFLEGLDNIRVEKVA